MNIINFPSKNDKNNKIDSDIVYDLECLLEEAKKGKIVSFACTSLNEKNEIKNTYSGNIKENFLSFIGMLDVIKMEIKQLYGNDND